MTDESTSDPSGGIVPGEAEDDGELDPSDALTGDPAVRDPEMGVVDVPDRYRFATGHGTTWDEERDGDSLAARLRQEEREPADEDPYLVDEQSEDHDGDLARAEGSTYRPPRLLVAEDGGLGPGLDQQQVAATSAFEESRATAPEDLAIHYDDRL